MEYLVTFLANLFPMFPSAAEIGANIGVLLGLG
jgi:hypothetical protein